MQTPYDTVCPCDTCMTVGLMYHPLTHVWPCDTCMPCDGARVWPGSESFAEQRI